MSVYIIAEAGVNHNGELERALAMVDAAAEAGADAVKFQTFLPEALASRHAAQADYQVRNQAEIQDEQSSQLAMLQRLVLPFEHHHTLLARCWEQGIEFLSTPFDSASARFLLEELALPRIKLGSGELTNGPLLLQVAQAGRPLILSTGMGTLDEIRTALGVITFGYLNPSAAPSGTDFDTAFNNPQGQRLLQERVTLLHCTTEYPCPLEQVNLRAMDTLRQATGLTVGYSDHTLGINVAIAAAARGANVIEKHFTLNRNLPGPDHLASLEPAELRNMVESIRELELALGSAEKEPTTAERSNAPIARKSLVAARPIRAGELFSRENLTVKRPGTGRSPMDYWDVLGTTADKDYTEDEMIS